MKFAEHLQTHVTSEWVKQYINYREMKSMLYAAIEQSPSAELVDPEVLTRYFAKFDEQFFHFCDSELAKINTFYSEKLAEATRKYANLRSELSEAQDEDITKEKKGRYRKNLLRKKNNSVRKIQELKLAFSEFYLSLILLQNYQNLNFTGFRKILKKHDKLLNVDFGAKWRIEHVEASHFYTNKDIDRLIQETENVVTTIEGGDRQRAMKRLRVPPLNEQQSPWTTFKVGLFSGSFIVLSVAVIISALFNKGRESWRPAFRLYRAPFLIIEFLFLWGINVYGWRSAGVNHVLIFELDPRNHLSDQHIMEMAAIFGVVWCVSVLCFLYSAALSIPAYVSPMALYILMVMFLMNPIKIFRFEARFWTMRILARVLCAPLFHVEFADFWVADQLNSIVPVFLDLQYFFCFFSTNANLNEAGDLRYCITNPGMITVRTIVAILPAWFRCSQCVRRYHDTKDMVHVYNACKYFSSFFVVIFSSVTFATTGHYEKNTDNPFFYLWICALVISSCYAYLWDIKMDWGLFDAKAGDNQFLREEIVYSSTWFYYIAIVGDFILRFGWTLSMSLIEMGYLESDIMLSILAPMEVLRRFVWNFFRLENEHLNNCGKFRAVRDISVAPMDSSDQATILRMMDEEDGVTNRRLKKNGKKKGEQRLLLDGMGDSQDDLNL